MKRLVVPIAVLLLLLFATPLFADMEFGLSFTPVGGIDSSSDPKSMLDDSIKGFHFGYIWWKVFYLSWDALVMPPSSVQAMTTSIVEDSYGNTYTREGYYRPGFLNLFDAGLRFVLGPIVLFTEAGVNQLRVYHQDVDLPDLSSDFGANLRAGAGLKFGWWGASLSVTKPFSSFAEIGTIAQYLAGDSYQQQLAVDSLTSGLVPSLMFTIYLQ